MVLHPPSTPSPWSPLSSMASHPPLLSTPPRLLRPRPPTSPPLRPPRLTGRSVTLRLTLPSSPATPPSCPPPLPPLQLRHLRPRLRLRTEQILLLDVECNCCTD